MPDHRPAMLLGLLHEGLPVEAPGLVHNGHVEEVGEGLGIAGELPVVEGEAPQVGPEHDSEGSQLTPTEEQLLGTIVPGMGVGWGEEHKHLNIIWGYLWNKMLKSLEILLLVLTTGRQIKQS